MLSAGSIYLRGKSPAAAGALRLADASRLRAGPMHPSGSIGPSMGRAASLQVGFIALQHLLVEVDAHVDAVVFVAGFVHTGALL